MVAYRAEEGGEEVEFLLHRALDAAEGGGGGTYVAVGISDDGEMGGDLVLAVLNGDTVAATWNREEGKANEGGVAGVQFSDVDVDVVDNVVTAKFKVGLHCA